MAPRGVGRDDVGRRIDIDDGWRVADFTHHVLNADDPRDALVRERLIAPRAGPRGSLLLARGGRHFHLLRAATMPNDDGGDHMKDAGLGVPPAPGLRSSSFTLESGHVLRDVVVAYSTYGVLNPPGITG